MDLVRDKGNTVNPKILCITDIPTFVNTDTKHFFTGKVGAFLDRVFSYVGLSWYDIMITPIIDDMDIYAGDISPQDYEVGINRISRLVNELNPQYIVAFGNDAAKKIFPKCTGIMKFRGKWAKSIFGIQGIATFSPSMVLIPGHDTKVPLVIQDFEKIWYKMNGYSSSYSDKNIEVKVIHTTADLFWLKDYAHDKKIMAYDWETTGLNPRVHEGICLGMAFEDNLGIVIPLHVMLNHTRWIRRIFSFIPEKIAFNGMFDAAWNRKYDLPDEITGDPMLIHALLYEVPQERNLERLSMDLCDADPYETEMLKKFNSKKGEMIYKIPPDEIYKYCGYDCVYTLRLYKMLWGRLEQYDKMVNLHKHLINPAENLLGEVQQNGFWVDQPKLQETTEKYMGIIATNQEKLTKITDDPKFNPNSHPQVQQYVWDVLGLKEPEIYKRKERSMDSETMKALIKKYPKELFITTLKEYREAYTMYSRYLRSIPDRIEEDGRLRCSIHMDRSETGRLSTTDPALHQIPRESDIRNIYATPPGYILVQADSKQIEIRVAAHIAQDETLTKLINSGVDFHTKMASEVFGIPVDKVTSAQRQAAKSVSFGLLYLMGDDGLASDTGLPKAEAKEFVKRYKQLMPKVFLWIARVKNIIRTQGYVESVFGRRRRFHLITKENINGLHREAVNMPVQSSASDLTLWQATQLNKILKEHPEWDARIILLVHDSIITECKEEFQSEVGQALIKCMETIPFETDVTFSAELKVGKCWA